MSIPSIPCVLHGARRLPWKIALFSRLGFQVVRDQLVVVFNPENKDGGVICMDLRFTGFLFLVGDVPFLEPLPEDFPLVGGKVYATVQSG